ncbi:3-hydroxyacyl-CoA dehydrogenase/enoyl-CoA hydratase family protein [Magnetospira sp. QH-2]|uniref:3-hydroxyacyl-CoA dehydrogenase/enoyl-CoA hydratase family protein n=1 Tax=Magnetospira sp. (strain QH-2) TaxID=1288970 RepID=UPI0003E819D3|nr:3-hydroxyacyl-CoA dehydrogenase/enoyl-CoA hydratase family protein [Magnetospira sp. QH-2]CCQ73248.1 Putative emzyme with 3-hydroxyacyl-CoA dehydrogenase and dodecenoyl-CoA isomerase domain [Magnetospira sp. QH-2]
MRGDGIHRVCVIGAGVMGAGIAAQAANGGAQVLLLDRDDIAREALTRLRKSKPAALMHKNLLGQIVPGNVERDLKQAADCDWFVEAIIEDMGIKAALYERLDAVRRPGTPVSSNTSTLTRATLIRDMPASLARDFLITHFFNPPRYMRLVEWVADPDQKFGSLKDFIDRRMGKRIIRCKDSPGFIANRIGTFWLHAAVTEAIKRSIDVETADALLGRPAGVPKTGVFGLLDLVGLDLMPHVLEAMREALAVDDPLLDLGPIPSLVTEMIADGYTGRKGKGGFYRLNNGVKEVRSLIDGSYAPARRPKPKAARGGGLRALINHDSPEGAYARAVVTRTLAYAARCLPEIAERPIDVDAAMRLGYAWKKGPFELNETLGAEKISLPKLPKPALLDSDPWGLADVKAQGAPLASNRSASLWDLGQGVAGLEFHSKLNALDPFSLAMMNKAVTLIPRRGMSALVIANDGTNFSVGANIAMLLVTGKLRLWPLINWILSHGQKTFARLKYAPFPVVGAPSGMALGGGCEVLLHCDALVAHGETYMGLVEAGVGIVPGWGGCKEMLGRLSEMPAIGRGPMPAVLKAFEIIATAQVATSAMEARDLGFLRSDDAIVMNRDRLWLQARDRALDMAPGYQPPKPRTLHLPGSSGRAALLMAIGDFERKGLTTPHDVTVARALARVMTGADTDPTDPVGEDHLLALERQAILSLIRTPQTRARVDHMLRKGKPLRN